MLNPLRRRPDEPPSSVTVTTAARSEMRAGSKAGWPAVATWRRNPRSSVESPVPPPMATTRIGRTRFKISRTPVGTCGDVKFDCGVPAEVTRNLGNLGIEQLGEARIVRHVLKIVVGAGLKPVPGIQLDGLGEALQAVLGAPRD